MPTARLAHRQAVSRKRRVTRRQANAVIAVACLLFSFAWHTTATAHHSGNLTDVGREALNRCESGDRGIPGSGDYTSRTFYTRDRNSWGGFHFEIPTWNATLDRMNAADYGDGYDWSIWKVADGSPTPDLLPPAIQDHVATFLYDADGAQPWSFGGNCGAFAQAAMNANPDPTVTLLTVHSLARAPIPTFTG